MTALHYAYCPWLGSEQIKPSYERPYTYFDIEKVDYALKIIDMLHRMVMSTGRCTNVAPRWLQEKRERRVKNYCLVFKPRAVSHLWDDRLFSWIGNDILGGTRTRIPNSVAMSARIWIKHGQPPRGLRRWGTAIPPEAISRAPTAINRMLLSYIKSSTENK